MSSPGPNCAATRSRNQTASAGLAPPLDTATVTRPWRWTAGNTAVQRSGSSALFTHTPAARASAETSPSTSGSPVAVTTSR